MHSGTRIDPSRDRGEKRDTGTSTSARQKEDRFLLDLCLWIFLSGLKEDLDGGARQLSSVERQQQRAKSREHRWKEKKEKENSLEGGTGKEKPDARRRGSTRNLSILCTLRE